MLDRPGYDALRASAPRGDLVAPSGRTGCRPGTRAMELGGAHRGRKMGDRGIFTFAQPPTMQLDARAPQAGRLDRSGFGACFRVGVWHRGSGDATIAGFSRAAPRAGYGCGAIVGVAWGACNVEEADATSASPWDDSQAASMRAGERATQVFAGFRAGPGRRNGVWRGPHAGGTVWARRQRTRHAHRGHMGVSVALTTSIVTRPLATGGNALDDPTPNVADLRIAALVAACS
jgi:hypothetical protein